MNKIKFPDFKPPDVKVPDPRTPLRYLLTFFLILSGAVGLTISFYNPVPYHTANLPDCLDIYIHNGCYVHSSLLYVDGVIETLNNYMLYVVSVSVGLLVLGILQPEVRRGIRSFPSKVIAAYRKVRSWRDWLFAKIEYLNGESAKWKRTFNVLKSPYSLLRALGLNPQMAIGLLAVGSTAGTGVIVNETVLAERSFSNSDSGVYDAPSDVPLALNTKDLPSPIMQALSEENTLAISLGAIPVREIKLDDISIGEIYKGSAGTDAGNTSVIPSVCDATNPAKSGNAKCPAILVTGIPAIAASGDTPAQVATRIRIGQMEVSTSRCKTMQFEDIDVHTLELHHTVADGISVYQTAGYAPRRTQLLGSHSSENMNTSGGTFDRLLVIAGTSGISANIGTLSLKNIFSKGSSCIFKNLDIGVLKILENEVGHDNNLATKDFKILNTVTARNWSLIDNFELNFTEPATQLANP